MGQTCAGGEESKVRLEVLSFYVDHDIEILMLMLLRLSWLDGAELCCRGNYRLTTNRLKVKVLLEVIYGLGDHDNDI